ncbi:hypothetical protein Pan14r_15190 [Crateriforma conspicua]|uniref:Uncharacterized protein n=1 Tax=Crateriforma conspicua TaxID=2527996 RepID=A0A5C5Y1Z3_9PLAN|nr:hypothetical protein Pan14r_15190 [Crateriforma conspicua]
MRWSLGAMYGTNGRGGAWKAEEVKPEKALRPLNLSLTDQRAA